MTHHIGGALLSFCSVRHLRKVAGDTLDADLLSMVILLENQFSTWESSKL